MMLGSRCRGRLQHRLYEIIERRGGMLPFLRGRSIILIVTELDSILALEPLVTQPSISLLIPLALPQIRSLADSTCAFSLFVGPKEPLEPYFVLVAGRDELEDGIAFSSNDWDEVSMAAGDVESYRLEGFVVFGVGVRIMGTWGGGVTSFGGGDIARCIGHIKKCVDRISFKSLPLG